ncbi:MAG: amidohydrolase [Gemmatimonadaceae bacterium]
MRRPPPQCTRPWRAPTIAALLFAASGPLVAQSAAPDVVLLGGKIFTADPDSPWAEALAVRGERIVAVGTSAQIAMLAGPGTRRMTLDGRVVVPGFDDAHAHAGLAGTPGVSVVVEDSPTPDPALDALLDSLAAAARRAPAGTWLTTAVGERVLDDPRATSATLDSVVPTHPVWIHGWSGHGAVLNTAAMRAAGLPDAPDPMGGRLTRDARGEPTGRIDEYALYGAERRLAVARGDSLLAIAIASYGETGLRLGITTVQDMTTQYDLASARAVARRGGGMRARHRLIRLPNTDLPGGWTADWRVAGADTALAPAMNVSGVKWILDGTPVERLALMRRPYADRPGWYGRANFPFDTLRSILRDALARGEQPHLHAVGDSTIALVIAAMRAEAPDSAWRRLRPRLEHADGLGRDQLRDVKALGMVIVQNPSHLSIPELLTARWGAERLRGADMLRTLVDSGVPLAIGSDGPREPGLNIMFATVHPSVPGEALTREQAVVAYTRGAAYAAFAERDRGTLAPGMLADIAVLSQDVFTVPPGALPATTSVLTLVGGRVVHDELPTVPAPPEER